MLQAETVFEAGALAVLAGYENWTVDEVKILTSMAWKDVKNPRIHTLFDL